MKTDNSNENQDERYQRATRKYTVSYMSNSKWRKLFAAVNEAGIEIEIAVWRYGYDHVPHATNRQDVDALVSVLRGIGMFMIDEAPDGITIRGYGGRR